MKHFNCAFPIMRREGLIIVLAFIASVSFAQKAPNTWDLFAKTKFESKFNEKLNEYLFYPDFSSDLKSLVGKEVILRGYFVPFAPEDGDFIILSKFPMSQCFFCGGGGPESIAEVYFASSPGKFKVDDLITVKGKLSLNIDDIDHLNFILKDCRVIEK